MTKEATPCESPSTFVWYSTCTRKGPEVLWSGSLWRSYLPPMKSNWVGWMSHWTNLISSTSTKLTARPLTMLENLTLNRICFPMQLYFFTFSSQICKLFIYIFQQWSSSTFFGRNVSRETWPIFQLPVPHPLPPHRNHHQQWQRQPGLLERRSSSGANLRSGKAPSGQEGTGLDDRS